MPEYQKYKKLVTKIVRKFYVNFKKRKYDFDDMMQIGFLGLFKALKRFDIKVNKVSFVTFAYYAINAELLNHLRDDRYFLSLNNKERKKNNFEIPVSLNSFVEFKDGKCELIDFVKGEDGININHLLIPIAIDKLEEKEKYVIVAKYYEDATQIEISKLLHCCQATVCNIEKRALKHLREMLEY